MYEFIEEACRRGWEYEGVEVIYETAEGRTMARVGFIRPWELSIMAPHSLKLELILSLDRNSTPYGSRVIGLSPELITKIRTLTSEPGTELCCVLVRGEQEGMNVRTFLGYLTQPIDFQKRNEIKRITIAQAKTEDGLDELVEIPDVWRINPVFYARE